MNDLTLAPDAASKTDTTNNKITVSVPMSETSTSIEVIHKVNKLVREKHPIVLAMDTFIHRVMDILHAADVFIPLSVQQDSLEIDEIKHNLDEARIALETGNKDIAIITQRKILENLSRLERCKQSKVPVILQHSLFITLFSMFDAYTGDLITAIFMKKGDLYKAINKSFALSELLDYESLEGIKLQALQSEIERFRRNSYIDQFKDLENMFGIKLTKFSKWPDFVECSQRRNLLTHCDGIVSSQYISICKENGCKLSDNISVGSKIVLGRGYLFSICNLMMEVAFRLGQTLWRKVLPEELELADDHLIEITYMMLERKDWKKAGLSNELCIRL